MATTEKWAKLFKSRHQYMDSVPVQFGDAKDAALTWDGTNLTLKPVTDDTGAFVIGDGTTDMDFKVFMNTSAKYVLFDQSASAVTLVATTLTMGADTTGTDFKLFGTTTGNYLLWDASEDDLTLVGTSTQLAIAGTTTSTTSTTGSLRTAGGLGVAGTANIGGTLGVVGVLTVSNATEATTTSAAALVVTGGIANGADCYFGDDIFLTSGAVLNFNAGNVTVTHAAGKLTVALPAPTSAIDGFTVSMTSGATGPGSLRAIVGSLTTFTSQASGTFAAIRGVVTTGGAVAASYMYGVQGKLVMGAHALTGASSHYCGVMAQMDISAGTLTSGHTACLVCSVQDTASVARALEGIYIELPTYGSGASMNSFVQGNGSATYGLDFVSANIDYLASVPLAATGKSPYSANSTHTAASTSKVGAIAIKVGTDTRYVFVFSDAGA